MGTKFGKMQNGKTHQRKYAVPQPTIPLSLLACIIHLLTLSMLTTTSVPTITLDCFPLVLGLLFSVLLGKLRICRILEQLVQDRTDELSMFRKLGFIAFCEITDVGRQNIRDDLEYLSDDVQRSESRVFRSKWWCWRAWSRRSRMTSRGRREEARYDFGGESGCCGFEMLW